MEQEVLWAVWNKASSGWYGTRGALGGMAWNRSSRWCGTRGALVVWNKRSSRWCGSRGALDVLEQKKVVVLKRGALGGVEQGGL